MASKADDSDEGRITPYKKSTVQDGTGSDCDSDYESEEEGQQSISNENIQWTGCRKKTPVILFNPEAFLNKRGNHKTVGERYHMSYKTDCQIVRKILNFHGFQEAESNSLDFNVIWIGAHLKAFTLHSMTEFQKINHFPRSYELTRKDNLYKNLQKMQKLKGFKNFDIIPPSFVLPSEYHNFCAAFLKNKGPWIVKPVASSRGRGVFLVNHPDQIPLDENIVVCKYISNPLLIDGLKFDVRLYVAVTSYDPLLIYLYEEGLTRFATVKYEWSPQHLNNQFMHLTNYSVNKKNEDYVKNDDAEVEDYGNKWSLGALLRYLHSTGKDTVALMMRIEDVIIKTILSVELPLATACKMFISHRGNCFELYGFDILIDENMKPWVLEVNMSPSLACDSPLDLKIKSHMICDLLSLAGIICHDPMMRTLENSKCSMEVKAKMTAAIKKQKTQAARSTAGTSVKKDKKEDRKTNSSGKNKASLKGEEIKVLRIVEEENQRKGGWVRIYPTADSWDLYSTFHQYSTTHNMMIHQRLFPERHKSSILLPKGTTASITSVGNRARSTFIHLNSNSHRTDAEMAASCTEALLRTNQYKRMLGTNGGRRRGDERRKLVQVVADESEGGEDENEDSEENEDEIESQNGKKNDTNMSTKVQARSAFAMYRVRVQQRLITDGPQMSQDDMDGLNEQMKAMIENLESECSGLREENFKLKMKVDMQQQALEFAKVKKGSFSTDEHQRNMTVKRKAETGTLDIELAKAFRDFFKDMKPVQQQIKDMKSQVPLQSDEQNDNLISTLKSQEKNLDIVDEKLADCVNSLRKSVATSLKKQKEKK